MLIITKLPIIFPGIFLYVQISKRLDNFSHQVKIPTRSYKTVTQLSSFGKKKFWPISLIFSCGDWVFFFKEESGFGVSAQTYHVGAHFIAFNKGNLIASYQIVKQRTEKLMEFVCHLSYQAKRSWVSKSKWTTNWSSIMS